MLVILSSDQFSVPVLKNIKQHFQVNHNIAYRPKKIFYYMQTYTFAPTFIVDISDYFQIKMKSVDAL